MFCFTEYKNDSSDVRKYIMCTWWKEQYVYSLIYLFAMMDTCVDAILLYNW